MIVYTASEAVHYEGTWTIDVYSSIDKAKHALHQTFSIDKDATWEETPDVGLGKGLCINGTTVDYEIEPYELDA